MRFLLHDFRFGIRGLRREPGFAAVAIATLALGIGASTTVFAIVDAVLIRSLPYPDARSLYLLQADQPELGTRAWPISFPNFEDFQKNRGFSSIAASQDLSVNLTEGSVAERVEASRVTGGLLSTLGVRPFLGRGFNAAETSPSGPDAVLLSHAFWTARFAADRSIVGRAIRIDGRSHLIAGVLPPGLAYPSSETQIWIPHRPRPQELNRGSSSLRVVARLAPGVTAAAAAAEVDAVGRTLARTYPDTVEGFRFLIRPLGDELVHDVRKPLWLLQAAAGLLLAIACVNVANLLLVRGASRGAELAIRAAMGATRRRILEQFLTESVLIGGAGGAAGVTIAALAVRSLRALPNAVLPRAGELHVDLRVLAFGLAVSLATALAFGISPALRASEKAIAGGLKSGRRGSGGSVNRGAMRTLVVTEVALAVLLLAGSGLLLRSFLAARRVDPGFRPGNLWTARVGLAPGRYPDPDRQEKYYREAARRLAGVRGVAGAAVVGRLPLLGTINWGSFTVQGQPVPNGSEPNADYLAVSPAFFDTMGIPVVAGREFTERDDVSSPHVAVVNQALARRFFPNQSAIGRRVQIGFDQKDFREIIGVVADVKMRSLEETSNPAIYLSLAQNVFTGHLRSANFVARFLPGPAGAIGADARAALAGLDAEQAVTPFRPVSEVVSDSLSRRRLNLHVTLLFGGLAAVLAAVGIYGVMAHRVAQRRQEIGIRMAMGAGRRDVVALVLREGGSLAAAGIGAGVLLSIPASRLLSGLLFGVSPADPEVLAGVALFVLSTCAVAVSLPARRAAALDPLRALQAT